MSDCSMSAMEPRQPRTCGNCYRYYNVRPTMRQGLCPLDELDEDGCAPIHNEDDVACGRWLEIEIPLEQRYERLAQVAREMFWFARDPLDFVERTGEKYVRDGHYFFTEIFAGQLEALGVSVDD